MTTALRHRHVQGHWGKAAGPCAHSHVAQVVHDGRASAADALASTRDGRRPRAWLDAQAALEGFVHSSLESAEELARRSRAAQRDLASSPDRSFVTGPPAPVRRTDPCVDGDPWSMMGA